MPHSPLALEAVTSIGRLGDLERGINGLTAEQRLTARQEQATPLVDDLDAWTREAGR